MRGSQDGHGARLTLPRLMSLETHLHWTTPDGQAAQALWRSEAGVPAPQRVPSVLDVVMTSVAIMQMRITRSRMAGDPPEVVVAPALASLGLLDFHRASEAIEEGRRAAKASLPQLQRFMR